MFSHITIGSSDIAKSRKFYDAVLGTLGAPAAIQDGKGRLIYKHAGGMLLVTPPVNGEKATGANGGTIGFNVDGPEQADAWHKAGVENGGMAVEDPPGVREGGSGKMYLAYMKDPDGNKLCALHRMK